MAKGGLSVVFETARLAVVALAADPEGDEATAQ
jgi:hypothetical protein